MEEGGAKEKSWREEEGREGEVCGGIICTPGHIASRTFGGKALSGRMTLPFHEEIKRHAFAVVVTRFL